MKDRAEWAVVCLTGAALFLFAWSLAHSETAVHQPDPKLTPGAAMPGVTVQDVCRRGYASRVRFVSARDKKSVFQEYGIAWALRGQYEVDHLLSLELGGSNDLANLWPEPLDEARKKDKIENFLHAQVCAGNLSLIEAQYQIRQWWPLYQRLINQKTLAKEANDTARNDSQAPAGQ